MYGSYTTEAMLPRTAKDGVPVVGVFSSADLSNPLQKYVFNLRISGAEQGRVLTIRVLDELKLSDVAIVYQDDAYGEAGRDGVLKKLARRKLAAVASFGWKRNSTDLTDVVKAVVDKKPKALIIVGLAPSTIIFLKEAVAAGLKASYFGISAVTTPSFVKIASSLSLSYDSLLYVPLTTDTSFSIVQNFQADMKAAGFTDTTNSNALEGYLDAAILVEAIKKIEKHLTREDLVTALQSMKDFDIGDLRSTFRQKTVTASVMDLPLKW